MMRAQSATEEYCKFYGEHANNVARIDLAIVPDNLYGKSRESASLWSSFKIVRACLAKWRSLVDFSLWYLFLL